ncbi:MAG: hypothetical protein K8R36_06620 [Planctomycetales bacterium]|nr:hypothetical protein [Planctomycetales bacterium]
MNSHPNKHIREAVDYVLEHGWTLREASGHAHVWGMLLCPRQERDGCRRGVYSTPRSPEDHAKDIRRAVNRCPHGVE